jgi:hypothetical protein
MKCVCMIGPTLIGSETGVDTGQSGVEAFDWGNHPTHASMEKGC